MSSRAAVAALGLLSTSLLAPIVRAADDEVVVKKIVELNRKALTHYGKKEFEPAKEALLEAVVAGKAAGLGAHKMVARTYVHLGAVHVDGLGDRTKGVRYLVLALKLRPDITLTPSIVTPTLTEAFAAAQAEASGAAPPAAVAEKPAARERPTPPAPMAKEPPAPAAPTGKERPTPPVPTASPASPPARPDAPAPPPKATKVVEAPNPPPTPPVEAAKPAEPKKPVAEAPKPAPPPPPAPAPSPAPPPAEPVAATEEAPKPARKKKRAGPEEPDLPANIPQPLHCPNPDEAPPGEEIALRCVTQPGLEAKRVLLFYRPGGAEQFTAVPTARSPKGWWNGAIPGKAVTGRSLQYYFEARDPADGVAGQAGRADSPNLMLIREGAPRVGKGALALLRYDREGGVDVEDENPLDAVEEERERVALAASIRRRQMGSIFVGFGIGSGYGYHGPTALEYRSDLELPEGVTARSGLLHLAPEIGYQLTDFFSLSLRGRHQIIRSEGSGGAQAGAPARAAHAVLARAIYYIGAANTQGMVGVSVGGGEGFRLVVPPDREIGLVRNDTVRGGPLLGGATLGLVHHFSPRFALTLAVDGLAGLPDRAYVVDLSAGLQVGF